MYEQPTEASAVRLTEPGRINDLTKNSDAPTSPFPSSAYVHSQRASGEADIFVASSRSSLVQTRRDGQATKPRSDLAKRDAIRRNLDKAVEQAQQMVAAAEADELIDLTNAGCRLLNILDDLWNLRNDREDNWGDLLNQLQTALAKQDFERFSRRQCEAIRDILSNYLRPWTIEDEDIRASIKLLREAGLDPWRAISGQQEEY